MEFFDEVYRAWTLPPILIDLMETPEAHRMRHINMSVMPNRFHTFCLPSRFYHGLGVARLIQEMSDAGAFSHGLEKSVNLFLAAAFLHDGGNPPFTHLAESFQKRLTGHNGESFLREIITGTKTERVFRLHGLSIDEVMQNVMGETPESKIIHGSMDCDNLDNITRYAVNAKIPVPLLDPLGIARNFIWNGSEWHLRAEVEDKARDWQTARAAVYGFIYEGEDLPACILLERALDFASEANELIPQFFRMNEAEAVEYMREECNPRTKLLIDSLETHNWFECVWSIRTEMPSDKYLELASVPGLNAALADELAEFYDIPRECIGVRISKGGRDRRRIKVPFERPDGSTFFDQSPETSIARGRVFLDREYLSRAPKIQDHMNRLVGL